MPSEFSGHRAASAANVHRSRVRRVENVTQTVDKYAAVNGGGGSYSQELGIELGQVAEGVAELV